MPDTPQPPPGQMVLYDEILPPLEDNTYRLTVETDVTIDGNPEDLPPKPSFFSIQGPRFQLAPTEVAGVYPPRNGHGSFSDAVPHIVLSRRTLPWERVLDPANKIPAPTIQAGDAPLPSPFVPPWLALLVFEEGDNFHIIQNVPLEQIVGPSIFFDLGNPPNVNCDALQTDLGTLATLLPSLEELALLAHVRQVNVNDRELNIGSTDGFFAVIMSNRLPSPNSNCTACLVSLEARSDIVSADPPVPLFRPVERHLRQADVAVIGGLGGTISGINPIIYFAESVQLVLLHSWKFACIGPGSFRDLMQGLSVAMIGTVANPGHPPLTDTCHIPVELQDRAGVPEPVFYRSPCTPFQLTRDPLGPYHSADQCRRATPETGAEDISYAAAFEVGRLIAAADKTLASALMQWRRDAYSQSARADTVGRAQTALNIGTLDLHAPVAPFLTAGASALIAQGAGPISDPFGVAQLQSAVGFNPTAVQQAFNLDTPQQALAILGANAGATGAAVNPIVQTTRNATTIDAVAADTVGLGRLTQNRNQKLVNTTVQIGPPAVSGISPAAGPTAGGTTVTITGVHFAGSTGVAFGPVAATGVSIVSDIVMTAISPAGQGTIDVTLISPAGTSALNSADQFAYLPPPAVTDVKPNEGPAAGGTAVTLTGSGFTQATAVQFGTSASSSLGVTSDNTIQAVSPPGTGTVDIQVTTPGGTSVAIAAATVSAGSGILHGTFLFDLDLGREVGAGAFSDLWWDQQTDVLRQMVPQGNARILNLGSVDFDSLSAPQLENLSYGTTPINGNNDASNQLVNGDVFAVLTHGGNYAKVQVLNYGYDLGIIWETFSGTSPSDQFTYLASPAVANVTPNQGSALGGTQVTVGGSGFTGASAVQFGAAASASFLVTSDVALQAVSPSGSGTVDVTVTTLAGTSPTGSADQFTYIPPPVVTGLTPNIQFAGNSIVVSGSGFTGASAVTFGSVPAASFTVNSDSQLTVVVPQGSGTVDVTVTTPGGTSAITANDNFVYAVLE
jgi:IPT/TIG domain